MAVINRKLPIRESPDLDGRRMLQLLLTVLGVLMLLLLVAYVCWFSMSQVRQREAWSHTVALLTMPSSDEIALRLMVGGAGSSPGSSVRAVRDRRQQGDRAEARIEPRVLDHDRNVGFEQA